MTESCRHGYMPGMCPKGCSSTADDSIPPAIPPGPKVDWEDKLHCVICGEVVESGKVYKGKPICDSCMSGMKDTGYDPKPKVPQVTEDIKKKFPMQGSVCLSGKERKTPPE